MNMEKSREMGQITTSLICHPKESEFIFKPSVTEVFRKQRFMIIHFGNLFLQLVESSEARRLTLTNHIFNEEN